jgi:uncharacterized protein (DUF885 family)
VLKYGNLPLGLLETRIEEWITRLNKGDK